MNNRKQSAREQHVSDKLNITKLNSKNKLNFYKNAYLLNYAGKIRIYFTI